jgi:error-prone DNA polymerase
VESRAQMSCLPRLRPIRFYDVVVQVAIIRPGPIVGQMVNPFLERRQGRQEVTYAHPSLEPVLKRTLGVPLFQEQLLRIAMIAANFTGGEAEDLRRAMGFKRSQARMKEIEAKLRSGMTANGIAPKAQEEIILSITSFALYGFPESHAASFALIAYASAYLKCHYLAAFTAALLNNQPMGFYSPATIVKDAQRHGLKLLPVDVTKSEWNCTLETVRDQGSGARDQSKVVGGQWSVTSKGFAILPPQETRGAEESRHSTEIGTEYSQLEGASHPRLLQSRKGRDVKAQDGSPGKAPQDWNESRRDGTETADTIALRMGLRYVRGMREEGARSLLRERMLAPFTSVHDLAHRVPELRKDELTTLAEIGALNSVASGQWPLASETCNSLPRIFTDVINNRQSTINDSSVTPRLRGENKLHRRDALWQVERAVRPSGPLLESQPELDAPSPLAPMNHEERLVADFHGTGLTVGPHPMAYKRAWLNAMGIRRAIELRDLPTGKRLRIGGCVITRQRPGTAKGFVFLSLEDETGVANAIVRPDLFHQNRLLLTSERFLAVEGILQNQDNVISVRAERVQPLFVTKAETSSHDFH